MMAQVPLAVAGRGVALLLDDLGQRHFAGADAVVRAMGSAPLDARRARCSSRSSAPPATPSRRPAST